MSRSRYSAGSSRFTRRMFDNLIAHRPEWLCHDGCATTAVPLSLLQLGVFRFRGGQYGDAGVGLSPQREEVLISGAGLRGVAGDGVGAAQAKVSERHQRIGRGPGMQSQYFLK